MIVQNRYPLNVGLTDGTTMVSPTSSHTLTAISDSIALIHQSWLIRASDPIIDQKSATISTLVID